MPASSVDVLFVVRNYLNFKDREKGAKFYSLRRFVRKL